MSGWGFLFASIAVHIALWLLFSSMPAPQPPSQPVEVAIQEIPREQFQKNKQQIVALPEVKNQKEEKPKNARFLGERDIKIEKETKAANNGLTRNSNPASSQGQNQPPPKPLDLKALTPKASDQLSAEEGLTAPVKKQKDRTEMEKLKRLRQNLFQVASANSNYLPDVDDGAVTMLNTERFVYYSFFHRISDQVYPQWQKQIHETVARMSEADVRRIQDRELTTVLDVVVRPDGIIEDAVVTRSSGVEQIDEAARRAFLECRQFPNPPKGLVKEDGKLHLAFGTHVSSDKIPAFAFKNQ